MNKEEAYLAKASEYFMVLRDFEKVLDDFSEAFSNSNNDSELLAKLDAEYNEMLEQLPAVEMDGDLYDQAVALGERVYQ